MDLLLQSAFLSPLRLTLLVAGQATVAALILGVGIAYIMGRYRFIGRDMLDAILTLPLVLPPTVLGYYILVVVGRRGLLGAWLYETFGVQLIFSVHGAVLAATVVSFPMVFKSARAALEGVGENFQNAARSMGASELKVFVRVTLPLAMRGIAAGTMLAFARAMGEFGATLMVAGNLPGKTQTLSLAVYSAVQAGQDDLANLLVCVISVVCVAILVLSSKLIALR